MARKPPSNRQPNSNVVIMDETPHREHMVYQSLQADAYLEGNVARTLADLVAAVKAAGAKDGGFLQGKDM